MTERVVPTSSFLFFCLTGFHSIRIGLLRQQNKTENKKKTHHTQNVGGFWYVGRRHLPMIEITLPNDGEGDKAD